MGLRVGPGRAPKPVPLRRAREPRQGIRRLTDVRKAEGSRASEPEDALVDEVGDLLGQADDLLLLVVERLEPVEVEREIVVEVPEILPLDAQLLPGLGFDRAALVFRERRVKAGQEVLHVPL